MQTPFTAKIAKEIRIKEIPKQKQRIKHIWRVFEKKTRWKEQLIERSSTIQKKKKSNFKVTN